VRRRSLTWLGAAVVAAILLAAALATAAAIRDVGHRSDDAEAAVAGPAIRALASEVDSSAASIEDLRAFFEASDEVTDDDFARFTAAPLERQASLEQLAWTPLDGGPGQVARVPGAPEDLGESIAGEARRIAAEARDRAVPRMSAPFTTAGGDRFVVTVAAVYARGARIDTVAQRRAALRGFVSGACRLGTLEEAALAGLPEGTRIHVRDGDAAVIGDAAPAGATAGTIDVAGRRWDVAVSGVAGPSAALPVAVAAAGLLLAAVVALLFVESAGRERDVRDELARLRVRHDLILSAAGDGIIGVDASGRAAFVNPAAARMLGWSVEELTGREVGDGILPSLGPALREGRAASGEDTLRRRDGTSFPGEYTSSPIADGRAKGAVVTFRDVTARKRLETQTLESLAAAEELAAIDPLTGLANHRTFHERLRTEVERARRHGRGLSLVLMDLDHFKRVNDLHGHQMGDRVLEHAARIFESETRTGELVARVGGEEFAMILPEADEDEAFRAAERIRRAVAAATFPAVGAMTMSAGVCDLSRGPDADTLYRLADGALYWAKHRGRDMVLRYSPEAVASLSANEEAERLERQQALVSIRLLARVVDAKDRSTRRHSERVADLCLELAEALGWPPERASLLREAGLVHDVGKIGVPDAILFKPGPLTEAEYEIVKEHASLGAQIVSEALTEEQVSWVRSHHERWDGNGYPDALEAEECPEGARIMALADAWDVMTSERPYTTVPTSPADAILECRACAGGQFWPPAVEALISIKAGA
jgi:diguanylate cyclase (GGDEF)-like protein/PAS domain S-box-containing protein/putative nucleotidyltransferase with HDIG domain